MDSLSLSLALVTHWQTCVCVSAPCVGSAFFCHSNMCINTSLVCNGIQNCVFPWDESNCKGTFSCAKTLDSQLVVLSYVIRRVRCVTLSLLEDLRLVFYKTFVTGHSRRLHAHLLLSNVPANPLCHFSPWLCWSCWISFQNFLLAGKQSSHLL